ncbi:MAG: pilus assembly protein [Kineosporiaceae bacterium]|nr:pilus assembly protein [Kineosporiaceae bacterium]
MTTDTTTATSPDTTPNTEPDGTARGRGDGGLMAVELAILTPFVIAMVLLVVAFGRITHARALVDGAASAAARAASLATGPGAAVTEGQAAALASLAAAGLACTGPTVAVDTSALRPGGQTAATVTCTADLSALVLIGVPGSLVLTAQAISPVEAHRDLSGGAP